MDQPKDTLLLIKEAKHWTLQKESELSPRDSAGVNASHSDHVCETNDLDNEGVRIECRGIGLAEKLSQLSLNEGEMLLVRLKPRRRPPTEKISRGSEEPPEQHQKVEKASRHSLGCQK